MHMKSVAGKRALYWCLHTHEKHSADGAFQKGSRAMARRNCLTLLAVGAVVASTNPASAQAALNGQLIAFVGWLERRFGKGSKR
jgi:hypothetical protein